jgi:hypothetical protein
MTNQCKSAAREIRANGGILDIYGEKVNVIEGFFMSFCATGGYDAVKQAKRSANGLCVHACALG